MPIPSMLSGSTGSRLSQSSHRAISMVWETVVWFIMSAGAAGGCSMFQNEWSVDLCGAGGAVKSGVLESTGDARGF